jgi:hypothetical protein
VNIEKMGLRFPQPAASPPCRCGPNIAPAKPIRPRVASRDVVLFERRDRLGLTVTSRPGVVDPAEALSVDWSQR